MGRLIAGVLVVACLVAGAVCPAIASAWGLRAPTASARSRRAEARAPTTCAARRGRTSCANQRAQQGALQPLPGAADEHADDREGQPVAGIAAGMSLGT